MKIQMYATGEGGVVMRDNIRSGYVREQSNQDKILKDKYTTVGEKLFCLLPYCVILWHTT